MLLQNYWTYKFADTLNSQNSFTLKGINGTNITPYTFSQSYPSETRYNLQFSAGLILYVGSGNTPPTKSDYNLETSLDIVSNLNIVVNNSSNSCVIIVSANLTNSTDAEITINEVGIAKNFFVSGSSRGVALLTRSVINPIKIPAGESVGITYAITFEEK